MTAIHTAAAAALTLGLVSAVNAQQPPSDTAGAANQSLDEVTVTGSRIRRTTDFDTANPTTVVDETYIKNLGLVNVGDVIAQLPANLSNNQPTTTGNAAFFAGSTIANLRGLNPFFGSRTLTLLNSRRFVPTNQGDGVDLNFLPSVLIDRVDIVTGGASAAYGSGAISGVNNVFLNRRLEGGKLEVDFGETGQSDGRERHIGLAYGAALFENRAHFVVGAEYEKIDAVGCYNARDWCAEGNGFITNPIVNAMAPAASQIRANGQNIADAPGFILGSNVRKNQISTTGTFYTPSQTATQTLQANAAGTGVAPFNLGQQPFSGLSATNDVIGGDGRSIFQYTNLRSPVERRVATGTFTYALTDSVNMSVDLSYGKVETVNITGAADAQNIRVFGENAFIQGNALAAAQAQYINTTGPNAGAALLNKDWTSQVNSFSAVTTDVKRGVVSFDGKFGATSWGWDGYYQYGLTNREQLVNDNRHLVAYLMATDAVLDNRAGSATFGQPVCRVTRDGFAAASAFNTAYANTNPLLATGCVPLNAFGNQKLSQAAHDYAFGFLDENLRYEQQVVALNTSGDVFAGFGAGAIQTAVGVEYRTEKGDNIAAKGKNIPDYVRIDYATQYGESFAGDVNVTEGYIETNLPVIRDRPGIKKLEFNVAARESRYDNQGGFGTSGESRTRNLFTWKLQGLYDPLDWLRFRATQSRDARAPNFRELYYRQIISPAGTFGYCGPTGTNTDPCTLDFRGNVNLKPEKADTTTIGFVITPKEWASGLQLAIDYFRINVMDSINQGSSRVVLDGCNNGKGDPALCALLTLGPPTDPTNPYSNVVTLLGPSYNGKGYTYKGVDITANYLWDLGDVGNLNFRLLGSHMIGQKYQATTALPQYNVVGQTGTANSFLSDNQPSAKWLANLSATFNHGPIAITGQMRYVSEGTFNSRGVAPGDPGYPNGFILGGASLSSNHVPSYQVFTLSGSYAFADLFGTQTLQVFGVVDNVFDRAPPIAVGNGANQNGGTNPVFFDTMGRAYRLGIRAQF